MAVAIEAPSRDELGDLTDAFNAVQRTAVGLAAEQATLRHNVSEVFVNLGRRTQNLITRQIDQIDHLEERTDDPDTLSDLFLLDHLATRLRRNAENMLVLAGAFLALGWWADGQAQDVRATDVWVYNALAAMAFLVGVLCIPFAGAGFYRVMHNRRALKH